jgi:hypothetical protein
MYITSLNVHSLAFAQSAGSTSVLRKKTAIFFQNVKLCEFVAVKMCVFLQENSIFRLFSLHYLPCNTIIQQPGQLSQYSD